MALIWTQPRDWKAKEPITKEKLNAISDDLLYLFNPSFQMVTVPGTGTNVTPSSVPFVDLDAATYGLSVELSGSRAVKIEMTGAWSNATLAAQNRMDFFIDNSIYASSLTGTPNAQGVWMQTQPVAVHILPVSIRLTIPAGILAAGVHTFKPRVSMSAGTLTWYENTVWSQFKVGEY